VRDPQAAFWPFIVVWVTLGISGFFFFTRSRDVDLKRRLYPVYVIAAAVLFGAFILFTAKHWTVPLAMIPLLVVIVMINLRSVRFCGSCGRMTRSSWPIRRPTYCDACGASLTD
jgi:hypothetical protein